MLVNKLVEPYARTHQQRWHSEALQTFGERIVFRHRWNIKDYAQGRVERCTYCSAGVRLNERQRIRIIGATDGYFTLTFVGQTTVSLDYNATAVQVQTALESLDVNTSGDISVTGDDISSATGFIIEFKGQWTYVENIPDITYSGSTLDPGTAAIEIIQIREGSGGQDISDRYAAVYKQSGDSWCINCFGVGFDGGFEPIIYITFALIGDQQAETTRTIGGAFQHEDPKVQFSFEPVVQEFDLMARVHTWEIDNVTPKEIHGRYLLREIMPITLRTGPGSPDEEYIKMPPEFKTAYQMPERDWIIGQTGGLEVVPFSHVWNLVPLTRNEERLVEMGVDRRKWYQQAPVTVPFDPRAT